MIKYVTVKTYEIKRFWYVSQYFPIIYSEGLKKNTNNINWTIERVKKNSVIRVREQSISTKRPPLVGEVSANFCGV
jgi:hypothetical protein